MNGNQVFKTERLSIRHWVAADEARILALYSDPRVIKWIDDGDALTHGDAAKWMVLTRKNYTERGYGMFAIDHRETSETIGFGGLVHPGGQPEPEVKYAFLPNMWGLGLATEFVCGLLDYGTATHGLKRIIATVAGENGASMRVLAKSGLRHCGRRQETDGSHTEIFALPELP